MIDCRSSTIYICSRMNKNQCEQKYPIWRTIFVIRECLYASGFEIALWLSFTTNTQTMSLACTHKLLSEHVNVYIPISCTRVVARTFHLTLLMLKVFEIEIKLRYIIESYKNIIFLFDLSLEFHMNILK